VPDGSAAADETIHRALGRAGPVAPYTTDLAARILLPPGFVELGDPVYGRGTVYAACRRDGIDAGGLPYPHHGSWGATLPLKRVAADRVQTTSSCQRWWRQCATAHESLPPERSCTRPATG
jgi:hypothetical protein